MNATTPRLRTTLMLVAVALGASLEVSAALTDISQSPLASSSANLVKPNISYVLDASGSMNWSHAPDESQPFSNGIGYKSSQCNSIYYNPNIIYPPPRVYDGTSFAASSFTAAPKDGFSAYDGGSTATVNLGSAFYAYDNTSSNGAGTDTLQQAYYYVYHGSQQASGANYQNTGSTFYQECNSPEDANGTPTATITFGGNPSPNNGTIVNQITVGGTNLMSAATSSTTSNSTMATNVAALITLNGYSATASGSTVTINGPTSLAVANPPLPVVTATPPFTKATLTFTGTKNTSVTSIKVNGVEITTGDSTPSATQNTVASNVAAIIGANGFTATVSGNVVTMTGPVSFAGATAVVTMAGNQVATVVFAGSNNSAVTGITVGGTQIMTGTATASTSATMASTVDPLIAANGFSATSSASTVTITGPPAPSTYANPVVAVTTGGPTATITFVGSNATIVSGIKVGGVQIMGAASAVANTTAAMAAAVDAAINANGFTATSAGSVVTVTGPPGTTGAPIVTAVAGGVTGTITVSGTASSTSVTAIKVGGTTITSGTATGSTNAALASSIQSKISVAGYTATVSGSTVTVLGPTSAAGVVPAVTKTGTMTVSTTSLALVSPMGNAATSFSGPTPMTATVSAFTQQSTMAVAATAFPAPGVMTATITPFAPFVRTQVTSTSGPGNTDERQNFANWFTYYRTRILMMKSGLGRAFVSIGSNYRVGFMTIQADPSSDSFPDYLPIADFATGTATATSCSSPQKCKWFRAVYSQIPSQSTPLKQALSYAAQNLAGRRGPDPGQYSCQQNFILMSTDGYWNATTPNGKRLNLTTDIGDWDNNTTNAPRPQYDGSPAGVFDSTSNKTFTGADTLADVAWYYYNTDLRSATANAPRNAPAIACNTGVSGADMCNDNVPISGLDNAPWQHVTTFTLGLGVNGLLNYAPDYLTTGSADFNAIVSGSKNWPVPIGDKLTTIDDLWHTAVNGHGQYFSAKNPDLLVSGLNTALSGVSARLAAGAAAATSNLEPVAGDNFAFVASYTTQTWTGDLQSRTINLTTGAISTTPNWSAQATLDTMATDSSDTRTIFFNSGTSTSPILTPFLPANFSTTQKTNWFTPVNAPQLSQYAGWAATQQTAGTADSVINYLRGQFGNEERGTNLAANQLYRVRGHVLGDIIDGKPVYMRLPPFNYTENNYSTFKTSSTVTGRTGTVYVGGNDGMLHAFDATNGNEIWAFIPTAVLPNLKSLADDNYPTNHKYFVDGSPVVTDIWNGSAWKTILVVGLGAGGKSYFALDVTTPGSPALLWEFTDSNLGYTFGNPVVGKLTNGTWVVAFTSGYNNVGDGVGRLFVVNAWTGVQISAISTGQGSATTPSGLNKIAAWVDQGLVDNTMQRIYGGDQLGNLWRFDINNQYPPAGLDAVQLANFVAGSYVQPITTQPELGLVNGVPVVYVGTGRYIGASDLSDLNQQSLYAIVDKLTGTGIGNARTETTCPLVQQSLTVIDVNTRSTSTLPVDLTTKCGWFVDFNPTGGNTPGERVNIDPKLQLGVLAVATNIPDASVCTVGGSSFLYFFDYSTGRFVSTATNNVAGTRIGNAIAVGVNTYQLPSGQVVSTVTTSDDQHPTFGNPSSPGIFDIGKRVMWRELLN
jgi:type IV pilus assembly protein PilY1